MTLDREIRFSPEQITYTQKAVRTRIRTLGRSVAAAEANHRAGHTIQHGTHDRNVAELAALSQVADNLEAARQQIARRIADKVRGGAA